MALKPVLPPGLVNVPAGSSPSALGANIIALSTPAADGSIVYANADGSAHTELASALVINQIKDSTDPTKVAQFDASGITTSTTRTTTIPNANNTLVVPDTGASHNFLTAISAAGAISKAQPAIADVSDATTVGQNIVKLTNPSALSYVKIAANNTVSSLTPSQVLSDIGAQASGSYANTGADWTLAAYQAMGSTVKAQSVGCRMSDISGSFNMGSSGSFQRVYFIAVYLPTAATLIGVKWFQAIQGDYTASNYNGVGLYSYSGGTLTLVASSTTDGTIWKAATATFSSKAFSSTYAAAAGLYYVVLSYSASASVALPKLGQIGWTATPYLNTTVPAGDFTNSAFISGQLDSLTALPSPTQAASGVTMSQFTNIWVGVY